MSTNVGVDVGAKKLGEKLLAEVEWEELSSVLKSLRDLQGQTRPNISTTSIPPANNVFNIPALDALLPAPTPPILELISPPQTHHPSRSGKTSLLYLIITHAIFPAKFNPSISLGGQNAVVILFDPLHHFSIPRLAEVMLNHCMTKIQLAGKGKDLYETTTAEIKGIVKRSLTHLHVFRPQSWPSMLATLRSLPEYLFDANRHKSMQRRIHSIILEDVDAFVWSIRASSTPPPPPVTSTTISNSSLADASTHLTNLLHRLTSQFSCAAILTSHSVSTTPISFRPAIPTSWPQNMTITRLAVRRIEVVKFAPTMSVEEAEAERGQRWAVVSRGRFECWRVGIGVKDGEGFVFNVKGTGVEIEIEDV